MKAYSADLRERVVKALLEGKTQAWAVSTKTMSRMLVRLGLRRKKDHRRGGVG